MWQQLVTGAAQPGAGTGHKVSICTYSPENLHVCVCVCVCVCMHVCSVCVCVRTYMCLGLYACGHKVAITILGCVLPLLPLSTTI